VPASIATAKAQPVDEGRPSSTAQLPTATLTYLDVLERLEPRRCTISVDGTQIGGEFLLVEVLNMPCVGPNLLLSEEADPSDGFFTVVTATESDRDDLADYLEHRLDGQHHPLSLATRRARRVEIRGWDVTHVDAKLLYAPDGVSVQIEPAALRVLA
jgi:diacylglycerol kinase family enzyme